jgi:uncharacterized protein with ATP-grasp and redox domains
MACKDPECAFCTLAEYMREKVAMGMPPDLIPELMFDVMKMLGAEYGVFKLEEIIEVPEEFADDRPNDDKVLLH